MYIYILISNISQKCGVSYFTSLISRIESIYGATDSSLLPKKVSRFMSIERGSVEPLVLGIASCDPFKDEFAGDTALKETCCRCSYLWKKASSIIRY